MRLRDLGVDVRHPELRFAGLVRDLQPRREPRLLLSQVVDFLLGADDLAVVLSARRWRFGRWRLVCQFRVRLLQPFAHQFVFGFAVVLIRRITLDPLLCGSEFPLELRDEFAVLLRLVAR